MSDSLPMVLSRRANSPVDSRSPSPDAMIPIQDRYAPSRQLVGWHEHDRSRTSYGDPEETFEATLSRIVVDDDLISFESGFESTYKNKYAETEMIFRTKLERALAVSI